MISSPCRSDRLTVWPVRWCQFAHRLDCRLAHRQPCLDQVAQFEQPHAKSIGAGLLAAIDEPADDHVV